VLVAVVAFDGGAESHRAEVKSPRQADLAFEIPKRVADEHLWFLIRRDHLE